ncbi:hypothetical protein [Microbacterium oleivorans]|uniref:Fibronectin type-III domain-containing protein n=1 Tax=Microbacterium oleivorans TaxID=273677 RepID=A0A7D5EXA7_9MICO|nr:hypothetical protein [Microbacterium oleivorans]QLD11964.1 hypothetical protein HW566_09425 [Microbacterium oleivorans]
MRSARRTLAVLAAAAAILMFAGPAPALASVPPAVVNGDFDDADGNGAPDGWSRWNPAGTAGVSVAADGPDGRTAATITSTSGPTARLALTQRVTVDAATPRRIVVRALVRGAALDAGYSMIRVQVRDATGRVIVPVASGPYLRGTFDWRVSETAITLPDTAASISVEPMLDRAAGSLSVTGVEIVEDVATGSLDAIVGERGAVELTWSFPDVTAAEYRVRRGTVDEPVWLRTSTASTVADETAQPGTTYTYVVDALDVAGAVLASTPLASATVPADVVDLVESPIVFARSTDDDTARASWAVPSGTGSVELRVDGATTPLTAATGSVEVAAAVGDTVELLADGAVVADARVGAVAHPRALLGANDIARVQASLAAGESTVVGAWDALVGRLVAPATAGYSSNGSAGLYEARDAAFAFAITGDTAYAKQAYDGLVDGEAFITARDTNMGLELGRAALLLAPAYDWAAPGWTDAQRTHVQAMMLRVSELLSTYHHDNLDTTGDKASNWVGVTRSTELAMLLMLAGDQTAASDDALDRRILFLTDQVAQHLDDGYTGTGWMQEGWDYLHYTELYLFPSIYMAQTAGLTALDAAFADIDFSGLALHVVSSRAAGDVAQFGVSGPNGQVDGALPLLFPLASDAAELGQLVEIYDAVHGTASVSQRFDGVHGLWTALFAPTAGERSLALAASAAAAALPALLDEDAGFAAFRDDVADADDAIVVTSNRNSQHKGWAAAETFSLSWISDDTTWAMQGGKAYADPSAWSKPLVDGQLEPYENQYRTLDGQGVTLDARSFGGQGGGYLELDGSANFGVDVAHRFEVVDLEPSGPATAIVAVADDFSDDTSHTWSWQLRPESGVVIALDEDASEAEPLFTFTSADAAGDPVVLSGFVLDREGLDAEVDDGVLRLSRTGTTAAFRIVLATAEEALSGALAGGGLAIGDAYIPIDDLGAVGAGGLPTPSAAHRH